MFPYQELLKALELDIASVSDLQLGSPLSSDMSTRAVQSEMLHRSFYKKLAPNGNATSADAKALEKFKSINESISTDPFEYPVENEQDALFWSYFRDNFTKALVHDDIVIDLEFVRSHMMAGPGSSLGCDNESFYTKVFSSRISVSTPYLLAYYRAAIVDSDVWAEAERLRFERFGVEIASRNRLFFVPKTTEISRTCCTEPLVNMLIQQAIGSFLECCLQRSFGVSLATQQEHNRELARVGSLDGSFGTIDLQSASDSISWSLVQRIAPNALLGLLRASRCERTILPDGSEMDLNMISTMGNGFTFPLQTVIFACVVRSVYQMMGLSSSCPKTQFGVFGDDIIVRREAYSFVVTCLTKLGFKVNADKSFNEGSFRESCGADWWRGFYCRGIYITSLETVSDVYSAINRLTRWSAMSGVPLRNACSVLRRGLRKSFAIPFSEDITSGIQTPFHFTRPRVDDKYWFSYKKLAPVPRRREVPLSVEESVAKGYKFFNPCGWEVAFLGGYARSEDIPLKSEGEGDLRPPSPRIPNAFLTLRDVDGVCRKKVTRLSVPWWDWLGSEGHLLPFSFGSWVRAFASNSEGCGG